MHIIFNQDIIHGGLSFLVLTFYHSSPLLPFDKYQTESSKIQAFEF